jgi:hypothetical protein
MLRQLGIIGPSQIAPPKYQMGVNTLIDTLNRDLGAEGFSFQLDQNNQVQGGFHRVYVTKQGDVHPSSFLDIQIGGNTPAGPAIRYQVSKENTFGVPGFPRLIDSQLGNTVRTFEDFVRAYHSRAEGEGKSPQQTIWTTYQEGDPNFNLPGSGSVLTPSSSSGKIAYEERTVRYIVPPTEPGISEMEKQQNYLRRIGGVIGTMTGLSELYGYVPEVNQWNALVPGTNFAWSGTNQMSGRPENRVQVVRGLGSEFKSQSTVREARSMATEPFIQDPRSGRMTRLQPTLPGQRQLTMDEIRQGAGIRRGWTQSSVILPGETAPRQVLSQSMLLADQADLPGAVYTSPSAFTVQDPRNPNRRRTIQGIGEKLTLMSELGISNMTQLEEIMGQGGFKIGKIQGTIMRSGTGRQKFGSMPTPGDPNAERLPLLVEKRGYDVAMGRPIIHVPQYYDQSTQDFYNVPGTGRIETTQIVASLRGMKGLNADVVGYSSIGIGGADSPAEVYMTIPSAGLNPVSIKTSGIKAAPSPVTDLSLKLAGVSGNVDIDLMTQEAKIPGRALMSSFGVMEPQVQQMFLRRFGGDKQRSAAAAKWLGQQYKDPNFAGIDLEQLADVFNTAVSNTPPSEYFSADMMFSQMFQRVLSTKSTRTAGNMYNIFGIGLPTTQMMKTTTYSESEKLAMEKMIADQPGLAGKVSFEQIPTSINASVTADGQMVEQKKLFRLSQAVSAHSSAVLQIGASFTPEYQSQSGYINPKGIMALAENFPETSKLMGLGRIVNIGGKDVQAFTGPNTMGEADSTRSIPSRRAWFDLWSWAGFQKDLNEFTPSIPAGTLEITESLASDLQDAVAQASMGKTSRDRLDIFHRALKDITKNNPDFTPDIDLTDRYMVDPGTGTLLPKLNSIMGAESYREGIREGETRTYIGDSYLKLVTAAAQSAVTEQGTNYGRVIQTRSRFFGRIAGEFEKKRGGSKRVYRNIYGVDLPGTRGGRYMGLPGLDTVEAVASEDYIKAMLHSNGFMNPEDVTSVMEYMNKGSDAYLPTLVQRFPDVSGAFQWMPVKLRTAKWFTDRGGELPKNAGTNGVFYMSQTLNRFFVGDFDGDPAMQKLIPITNVAWGKNPLDPDNKTFEWRIASPQAHQEFNRGLAAYEKSGKALDRALGAMFGDLGTANTDFSLDASRKNLAEYADAIQAGKGGSLGKRLGAVGTVTMMDLMTAGMKVKQFKMGMGVSYNRRTQTDDIMEMVLGSSDDAANANVREKAYESGAYMYQSYLDRSKFSQGDFSQLEDLFNSLSLRGYKPASADESAKYGASFMLSQQGREVRYGNQFDREAERKSTKWSEDVIMPGMKDSTYLLKAMYRRVIGKDAAEEATMTPEERAKTPFKGSFISNSMLARGFGNIGHGNIVFDMLEENDRLKNPASRAAIMNRALKEGHVGLNSPYYMTALYNLVRRTQEKNPMLMDDPNVLIPWIDGTFKPIGEIAKSKEFQQADVLKKLVVEGNLLAGSQEIEQLSNLGDTRLGRHMLGLVREWNLATGGSARTDPATQAIAEKMADLPKLMQNKLMKGTPLVHASEMGALAWQSTPGWTDPRLDIATKTQYGAIMRWMGLPQIFGDRDEGVKTVFKGVGYTHIGEDINSPSDIDKGNQFEAAFAGTSSLHHIGKVKRDEGDFSLVNSGNLTFNVGGLTVTGIPDFVDYDDTEGKLVIVDTKLARSDPEQNAAVRSRIASYKNRIQQVGYAYGLEKLAQGGETGWNELMRRWGFDLTKDADKLLNMRRAAAQGRFSVSLLPGNAMAGAVKTFNAIPIEYNDAVKQEYEGLASYVKNTVFSGEAVQKVSADVFSAVMSEGGYPALLGGTVERTGYNPPRKTYAGLEQIAKYGRAAFGGHFDKSRPQVIRVGEAGPEDIMIDENGVNIIPASQSPEARAGRTRGNEGFTGYRAAFGAGHLTPGGQPTQPPSQPPVNPPPPPPPVSPSLPGGQPDWDGFFNRLTDVLKGQPQPTIRLDFGNRAIPSNMKMEDIIRGGTESFNQLAKAAPELETNLQKVMVDAFDKAGLSDALADVTGGSADMLSKARNMGIDPALYEPGLKGFATQAKSVRSMGKGFETAYSWMQKYGTGERGADILSKLPPELKAQAESILSMPEALGGQGEAAIQSYMTSGEIAKIPKPGRYAGVPEADMKKFVDSIADLTESTKHLNDVQGNLAKTNEALHEQSKRTLASEYAESVIKQKAAVSQGGRFFDEAGNLRSAAQRAQISEPTTAEIGGLLSYQGEEEKQGKIRAAQDRLSGSGIGRGMSSLARSFLGGWGLMYVGTLARMGEAQYAEGYQQYEQTEMARTAALANTFGPNLGMGARTEQVYQNALARGGNIPYRQFRGLEGTIAGSGIGDITGALSKGVGMGALALFAGNLMSEAGATAALPGLATAGASLTGAMPWIAGGTALAGLAYNQYAYAVNPKDTGISIASGMGRARNLWESDQLSARIEVLGAKWKDLIPNMAPAGFGAQSLGEGTFAQRAGQTILQSQYQMHNTSFAGAPAQMWSPPQRTYGQVYDLLAQRAISQGGVSGFEQELIAPTIATVIGQTPAFDKYDAQTQYKVVGSMMKAGTYNQATAEKIMSGYTAGLPYDQASQAVGAIGGMGVNFNSRQSLIGQWANMGLDQTDLEKLSATANFLANLPDDLDKINKSGKDLTSSLQDMGQKYKGVIGTLKEQPVGQAMQAAQMAGALGINVSGLNNQIQGALALPTNQNLSAEQLSMLQASTASASNQQSFWIQTQAQMQQRGVSGGTAMNLTRQLAGSGIRGQQIASGLISGNPLMYSMAAANGVDLTQYGTTNIAGQRTSMNALAVSDINLAGQVTGLPLYSTSLRRGSISPQQNAISVFGQNWQQNDPFGFRAGVVNGGVVEGFEQMGAVGGNRWLQLQQFNLSHQYNQAQQGIQSAQIAMTSAFQTGVGLNAYAGSVNPQTGSAFGFNTGTWSTSIPGMGSFTSQGGGFWGQEDAQRALQNMQSQYGFQQSAQQLQMQSSQFYQNIALQQRGTQMQRGWTQQDWAFQDNTRQLQWGWKQEDFQENARFLTGRDRRLAERQMGRETIMYDLEGEQIDKTRDRQKETWKLEDEQFNLNKRHFAEQHALQVEANRMNKLFYEEGKRLQDEAVKLQRAYFVEGQKLQLASIGVSARYNQQMEALQKTQLEMTVSATDAQAEANLLTQALTDLEGVMKDIVKVLSDKGIVSGEGDNNNSKAHNEGDDVSGQPGYIWHWTGTAWIKKKDTGAAMGAHVFAGQGITINDTNIPEYFSPDQSGTIVPLTNLNPYLSTMVSAEKSGGSVRSGAVHLHLFIGDRHIKDLILDTIDQEIHL